MDLSSELARLGHSDYDRPMTSRRFLLGALVGIISAPAIVRAESLILSPRRMLVIPKRPLDKIEIIRQTVTAKSRFLDARWTMEESQTFIIGNAFRYARPR